LWHGDHIAPGALKHVVWQLRRDLDDDAKAPRYVETVRGRGYRLVAEVAEEAPSAAAAQAPRWLIAAVALVILCAVALTWWWPRRPTTQADDGPEAAGPGRRPLARPLTSLPGNEIEPAIAPDGSFVVFAWDGGETVEDGTDGEAEADFDLYSIATAGGAPELLVSSAEDEMKPAISSDGRWLAYLRGDVRLGGDELLWLELGTGNEESFATAAGHFLDVAWLEAGDRLVVSERPPDGAPVRLREIARDGSSRRLTEPPDETAGDFFPAVSPDGRSLAFYRLQLGGSGRVQLLDLATGTVEPLSTSVGRLVGLDFDPSGDSLIVSSDRVPPRGIWRLPLSGDEARWLGLPGSFVVEPASSRAGLVAYQDQRCDSNIWSLTLAESNEAPTPVASLTSTRQDMLAKFSRDGQRVALLSNRGGEVQIWIADWPQGSPRPLSTGGGPVLALDWAPDDQRLALAVRETGGVAAVQTVRVDGSEPQQISDPAVHSLAPSWSWDGGAIYYSALLEEGWRILRHDLESGTTVDQGPGIAAKEEPGGDVLWILNAGPPGLSRRSAGGEIESVVPYFSALDAESWQPVEGGVVFLHWERD
ncbi:MAG: winged helix-turn-helix domain-containing protein, partial [Acidobacteriota bacterium]